MRAYDTGVGPVDADLGPGGLSGRQRVGRRLRVRLDGPGRHGGGGLRRRPPLASPALPEADPAAVPAEADTYTHADAHTHPHADAHTHTDAHT
ncbi:hypothetical protein, partial [Streptomyces sp. SID161]|uniref:hypothetical protein n=1 Tax=Streptomyces sp. SID161 TaxID=2690251 RepID=UPI00192855E1